MKQRKITEYEVRKDMYEMSQQAPPSPFKKSLNPNAPGLPGAQQPNVQPPGAQPAAVLPSGADIRPGFIQFPMSLEGIEGSTFLDVGSHAAYVESIESVVAKSSGREGLKFNLRFLRFPGVNSDSTNHDKRSNLRVWFGPNSLWTVKNAMVAIGQPDGLTGLDVLAAENVLVIAEVENNEYMPQGETDPSKIVKTTQVARIKPWPDHLGGPGTQFNQVAYEQIVAENQRSSSP